MKYQIQPDEIPRSMKKFLSVYRNAREGMVVSANYQGETKYDGRLIRFIKWHEAENIDYLKNE